MLGTLRFAQPTSDSCTVSELGYEKNGKHEKKKSPPDHDQSELIERFLMKDPIPRTTYLLLFPIVATLLIGGCGTTPERELSTVRNEFVSLPNGHDPLKPDEFLPESSKMGAAAREGVIRYLERLHGHALNILEISGGGQNGAFGAGVLKGWRESGTRPEFDIVTGVSTGALLASHAFLGTAADDAVLEEAFTSISQKDIYLRQDLLDMIFGGNALVQTRPLQAMIAEMITPELLQRVATAYDQDRVLLIATTNLDYSQTWVWNLSLIAKRGGPKALDTYRKALLASASPPVAFPPVEIDGHLFADGMIRANLLVVGLTGEDAPGPPPYGPGTVYVIQNGKGNQPAKALTNNLQNIAGTALGQMMDGFTTSLMIRAYIGANSHGYHFRLADIPNDAATGNNPLAFDPAEMQAGFDAGYELGSHPGRWLDAPRNVGDVPLWAYQDGKPVGEKPH
jgi:predicted acylesterase/phospholipase RssA